jgi:hypothetical protein
MTRPTSIFQTRWTRYEVEEALKAAAEALGLAPTPRAIDSQLFEEAKKSSDEAKQRALLVARLEQDQRRKDGLDTATHSVLPTPPTPTVEAGASDESSIEAKQGALLVARLEQDQVRKKKTRWNQRHILCFPRRPWRQALRMSRLFKPNNELSY